MRRITGMAALAMLFGCTGGPPIGTDNTITTPTLPEPTTPTADTGTKPLDLGDLNPDLFRLNAWFAFDDKAGRFSNFATPEEGLTPITFAVSFFDIARQKACQIRYEIEGRPVATDWAVKKGAWVTLDVPDDATVVNGCEGYEFPDEFEDQKEGVLHHVTKWGWAFGVGPLAPATQTGIMQTNATRWTVIEPYLVGGAFMSNAFAGDPIADADGYSDIGEAFGFEVDGNFQVDTDGAGNTKPILKELVNTPNGVATGYYELTLELAPAVALTRVPAGGK